MAGVGNDGVGGTAHEAGGIDKGIDRIEGAADIFIIVAYTVAILVGNDSLSVFGVPEAEVGSLGSRTDADVVVVEGGIPGVHESYVEKDVVEIVIGVEDLILVGPAGFDADFPTGLEGVELLGGYAADGLEIDIAVYAESLVGEGDVVFGIPAESGAGDISDASFAWQVG